MLKLIPCYISIFSSIFFSMFVFVILYLSKNNFEKLLKELAYRDDVRDLILKKIKGRYDCNRLYKNSDLIIQIAKQYNLNIIYMLNMIEIWEKKLITLKREKDLFRLLEHGNERSLFLCFDLTLQNKNLLKKFKDWINYHSDPFLLKKIALSANGKSFNGKLAFLYYSEKIDEIRELVATPEWEVRYFALNIIIHDKDPKSIKAVWESFFDPRAEVRLLIIKDFQSDEKKEIFNILIEIIKKDPIFEVRKAAWERINNEFLDVFSFENLSFSNEDEIIHFLQLLRVGNIEDERFAFRYINSNEIEIRFYATRFLDKNGTLQKIAESVNLGDLDGIKRSLDILEKAAELSNTCFLLVLNTTNNPATLLLCARILTKYGQPDFISVLLSKVFELLRRNSTLIEVYEEALKCVFIRADENALKLLNEELKREALNEKVVNLICKYIPDKASNIFKETLFDIFINNNFESTIELRNAILKIEKGFLVEKIFSILFSNNFSQKVKRDAVRVLGQLNLEYCLQLILENLYIFPLEEAKLYAEILSNYNKTQFENKVKKLLLSCDTRLKAALVASLPEKLCSVFTNELKKFLMEKDPDMRIASAWALMKNKEINAYEDVVALLRDPVEKVRVEVSKALGTYGNNRILSSLELILDDDNEINIVKEAIIEGLMLSQDLKAIEILVKRLEKETENSLITTIISALSKKQKEEEIEYMIKMFKEGSAILKKRMIEIFKTIDTKIEDILLNLLNDSTLHDVVVEILEGSGYVDNKLRLISHREVEKRREVVDILCKVGSKKAYKGLIVAARDPDREIRIKVIKAIEFIAKKDYSEILEEMKNDPDPVVRKYTLWALERINVKNE